MKKITFKVVFRNENGGERLEEMKGYLFDEGIDLFVEGKTKRLYDEKTGRLICNLQCSLDNLKDEWENSKWKSMYENMVNNNDYYITLCKRREDLN